MIASDPLYGNAVTQKLPFCVSAISTVGFLGHHSRKIGLRKLILVSQCLGPEVISLTVQWPGSLTSRGLEKKIRTGKH